MPRKNTPKIRITIVSWEKKEILPTYFYITRTTCIQEYGNADKSTGFFPTSRVRNYNPWMGYSLRLCTLYIHLSHRGVVMKRWKQCPIASPVVFPPEFKDGEAPQTGLGENFRGGGGDLKKSCRAKGMPSPILDDEGVNKYVSSGSSISPV